MFIVTSVVHEEEICELFGNFMRRNFTSDHWKMLPAPLRIEYTSVEIPNDSGYYELEKIVTSFLESNGLKILFGKVKFRTSYGSVTIEYDPFVSSFSKLNI